MSTENVISVSIPVAVIDEAINHLHTLKQLLSPYVQALSEEERRDLFKLGDKSVGYIGKVNGYLTTHAQFIPPFMEVAEFTKDAAVVTSLQPVYQLLSSLLSDVNDTRMLAGSEAMTAARCITAMCAWPRTRTCRAPKRCMPI